VTGGLHGHTRAESICDESSPPVIGRGRRSQLKDSCRLLKRPNPCAKSIDLRERPFSVGERYF